MSFSRYRPFIISCACRITQKVSWFSQIRLFTVDSHTCLGPIDYILNTSAHTKKLLQGYSLAW